MIAIAMNCDGVMGAMTATLPAVGLDCRSLVTFDCLCRPLSALIGLCLPVAVFDELRYSRYSRVKQPPSRTTTSQDKC
jgi:hypothetical protein